MCYSAGRHTNGIERPERDLHMYRKYSIFSARAFGYEEREKVKLDLYIIQHLKMHYRWIKDNVFRENMK